MLIELLKPRRNNTPVTLPDGSSAQFNEDGYNRFTAEINSEQALLLLQHADTFVRADSADSADTVTADEFFAVSPAPASADGAPRSRGFRKSKG